MTNKIVKSEILFYGGAAIVGTIIYFIWKNEVKKGVKKIAETVEDLGSVSDGNEPTTDIGKMALYAGQPILNVVSGGALNNTLLDYEKLRNGTLHGPTTPAEKEEFRKNMERNKNDWFSNLKFW